MNSEKILFKEVTYYKNKGIRFLILFIGEAVIAVLFFIIIQLLKTNETINTPFQNHIIAAFFLIILIIAVLLTWGGFLTQNVVVVTHSGITRVFKMPPLIKRDFSISKDKIQSASWLSGKRLIYKNGRFIENTGNFNLSENHFHKLKIGYNNKQNLILEIANPDRLEQAFRKMFKTNRS